VIKEKKLIAIIDDEPDILNLVKINLEKSNFDTVSFTEATSFLEYLKNNKKPDLLILDLMLPDLDGIELCKDLRNSPEYQYLPIIILSAKTEETDKILGLELGADDYIAKPFSTKELVARVKAVLRRHHFYVDKKEDTDGIFEVNNILTIDKHKYLVFVNGETIKLTPTEFNILNILVEKKGWVYSRDQILNSLWGNDKIVIDRTIDVHIKNLREKLKEAGKYIKNVRGVGYKFEE